MLIKDSGCVKDSSIKSCPVGVPQRNVLSPALFNIHIDDLDTCFPEHLKVSIRILCHTIIVHKVSECIFREEHSKAMTHDVHKISNANFAEKAERTQKRVGGEVSRKAICCTFCGKFHPMN